MLISSGWPSICANITLLDIFQQARSDLRRKFFPQDDSNISPMLITTRAKQRMVFEIYTSIDSSMLGFAWYVF